VIKFLRNQRKTNLKGRKIPHPTGNISFSVTLDQIQRFLFFPKLIESVGGFPLKGREITSLNLSEPNLQV
jgi:hypothetical protein